MRRPWIRKKTRLKILAVSAVVSVLVEFFIFDPFTNSLFVSIVAQLLSKR